MLENYILNIDIESKTLEEICLNYIIPSALEYQNLLSENVLNLKQLNLDASLYAHQLHLLERISKNVNYNA